MNKKIIISIAVILVIAAASIVWWQARQKYSGPMEKVTVANIEEYSTLVWIAEKQGYFAENGLQVINKDYQSGKLAAEMLVKGEADMSVSADIVFVSNNFNHPDLRILGIAATVENVELVSKKSSGIVQPSDLKGKKIGITTASVSEFFFREFLIFNGIDVSEVELVYLNPKDMGKAIAQGNVDAVSTWSPNTFNVKKILGDDAVSWYEQGQQPYHMLLLAKEAYLRENPEVIRRFLKSLRQAEEFTNKNNEKAKKIIAERYNYTPEYSERYWPKFKFELGLSQDLLLIMEDQARFSIKNNLTNATKVPNYLNYIYADALEKVKPEAVTIIK